MVLGVVESREGVECIEEILETEGLDGISIGTTDLSKSLGVPGQRNHRLVVDAVDKILAAGRKTGKHIGITVRRGESPRKYIDKGFCMVYTSLTTLVTEAAQQFLKDARS
jgi:4-hydroxy-2-oxoheptanedioate aldolase